MQFRNDDHATEDDLERYAMGRLAEPDLAAFEEHLLICPQCQDRLSHEDAIRQSIQDAEPLLHQKPKTSLGWRLPKLAWAFGLAAMATVAFIGVWPSLRRAGQDPSLNPATVLLQSMRGSETTAASAPAGKSIALVFDLTELPAFAAYKIEVVDAQGHQVMRSEARPKNNKVETVLTSGLAVGSYYVRLYSPVLGLLREYALSVTG